MTISQAKDVPDDGRTRHTSRIVQAHLEPPRRYFLVLEEVVAHHRFKVVQDFSKHFEPLW